MKPPLTRADIATLTGQIDRLADPHGPDEWLALLRLLYAIGRRDLPLGRLFEGHVDALQIVTRYGSPEQRARIDASARTGAALGVWNADLPQEPMSLVGDRLTGAKAFASGAGLLSHALVSVDASGKRQLLHIDLERQPPKVDRSWWRVTGMQRSETHIVRWDEALIGADEWIGRPGDYVREPYFSGGAIRFAAVQAGGIAGIVDGVRDHLVTSGRDGDPRQRDRLAGLFDAAQSAADAVGNAARGWTSDDVAATLARVAAARVAVYAAGERALMLAAAAVGVQAMFVDHPLSDAMSDLTVYLRQPAPDFQRDRAGEAVAAGLLSPAL